MKKILIPLLTLVIGGLPITGAVPRAFASPETEAVGQALFYLVNHERQTHGLPALKPHPLLTQAAQKKAEDMMAGGYFEHDSPDGREFFLWIDETGYRYSIAGENLAANMNTISAEKMVESWMGSTLHRENILSPRYSETGMGVVSGTFEGKAAFFAVQTFGHPEVEAEENLVPKPAAEPEVEVKVEVEMKLEAKPAPVSREELVAGVSVTASSAPSATYPVKKGLASILEKLGEFLLNLF